MKNKKVDFIKKGEKFRIGENWYIFVEINDGCIPKSAFSKFWERHCLPCEENSYFFMPVLCLNNQQFYYIDAETIPDEWGSF